jgi:parvulin-like peptidyl-prolyl isomerase
MKKPTLFSKFVLSCTVYLSLITALPVLSATVTDSADTASSPVVATWGDRNKVISDDYLQWLAYLNLEDSAETLKEFVFMLDLADKAVRRGVDKESDVQMEITATRNKILGEALKRQMNDRITIPATEIEKFLQENAKAFHRPRKVLLRDIYMTLPNDPVQAEAVRRRMQAIRQQLKSGADFKRLARLESQSQSRFRDGLLGRVAIEELPKPVAPVVEKLQPGGISDVIEYNNGLMILYCERIDEAVNPTQAKQRELTRKNLHRVRSTQDWAALEENLLSEKHASVEVSERELEGLLAIRFPGVDQAAIPAARREKVKSDWILGTLLADHARSEGLDSTPQVVTALRWSPMRILAKRQLADQVKKKFSSPLEDELRRYYEDKKRRYRSFPQYKLAVIYFGKADKAVIRRAWDVTEQIDHDRLSFEEAARQYSKHPSARSDGLLGWVALGKMFKWDVIVMKAIRQLNPGEHTGLLRTTTGIWIYQLKEKQDARQLGFEEARDAVQKDLVTQRIEQLEDEIRQAAYASLNIKRRTD